MSFSEEKLEQAVIVLFKAEGFDHLIGENIHNVLPGFRKAQLIQSNGFFHAAS